VVWVGTPRVRSLVGEAFIGLLDFKLATLADRRGVPDFRSITSCACSALPPVPPGNVDLVLGAKFCRL
jgi:hypothetical protein